ncbi:hypothetical protein [Streptomyces eurythermus]|uniref:hypothetical protein n=1 Tax=Streptomyces eurythermus TaxID=42237 RepID=UPI0033CAE361
MTTRRTAQWLALGLCAAGLAAVQPAQAAQAAGKEQVLVSTGPQHPMPPSPSSRR